LLSERDTKIEYTTYNVGRKSPEKEKRKRREKRGKNIRMLAQPWDKTPRTPWKNRKEKRDKDIKDAKAPLQ